MVKFEQKEFVAPLAILNGASMIAGLGSTIKGSIDSGEQLELQEKQLQQQKIDSYKQQKAQQDQVNATNNLANATQNLANNPSTTMPKPAINNTLSNMNMKVGMNTMKPMTKAYSSVRFKRKEFGIGSVAKSLFTAPPTMATTWSEFKKQSTLLPTSMNVIGTGASIAGNVQASKGIKNMKEGLGNMKVQSANLTAQMKNNTLANDLNSAADSLTKTYSETNIKFRQKDFGVISNLGKKWYNSGVGKATTGIGKIAGDMLYDHRGKIIGGTLAGAGMAAVHYGVNKGIQHNMQKNGIDMAAIRDMQKEDQQQYPQQQMYADVQQQAPTQPQFKYDKNIHKRLVDQDTFGNPTHYKYVMKDASGKATENVVFRQRMTRGQVAGHMLKEHAVGPMSLGMSAVFEAPSVIEYSQDKNNLKALSDMARARKGLTPLPVKKVSTGTQQPVMNQQPQQQKSYSAVGKWLGNKWSTLSTNFKNWKKAPGENTLNWLDKGMLGGGQGKAGVTRFGDRFINYGKQNNSQFLQKTGEWIKNHPKTVMGASIAASTYTMGKTMGIGENLINKPMRAIDPNAYAYDDYKEQQIQ